MGSVTIPKAKFLGLVAPGSTSMTLDFAASMKGNQDFFCSADNRIMLWHILTESKDNNKMIKMTLELINED